MRSCTSFSIVDDDDDDDDDNENQKGATSDEWWFGGSFRVPIRKRKKGKIMYENARRRARIEDRRGTAHRLQSFQYFSNPTLRSQNCTKETADTNSNSYSYDNYIDIDLFDID